MRRDSTYRFVDQYNSEFNRCIQPMKDGYTDNYYMQMAQKSGVTRALVPIPELTRPAHRSSIDGDLAIGNQCEVEYRDTVGDTFHRDYQATADCTTRTTSGRNDIVTGKVAVDAGARLLLRRDDANRSRRTPTTTGCCC